MDKLKEIKAPFYPGKHKKNLYIGYFADGKWGVNTLKKLIDDKTININFVCLRYQKPDPEIKSLCEKYNIPIFIEKNVNSESFLSKISNYKNDLFVSMSFDQIIRKKLLNIPVYGFINCHAGKLPFYRGRNVLNWVLINDEKEFGITVHFIDEGIDTGDIILQRTYLITDEDNYSTLLNRAYVECANILYDAIKIIQSSDKIIPVKQKEIHPIGFYCPRRIEGDEIIDWNQSSREIFNFVRAICIPGPRAKSFINGKEIRINKVKLIQGAPIYKAIPGAILKIEKDGFLVKTKDTFIKVVEYEYNGKIKIGDRLK